ncbi:hypothetical protein GGR91_000742 [Sphingorhabdus rigui]|uniref:Uncharacterized protein n=1 Tax=Sphingorhabdus rigui TaxID=1282858 RepID=A0A840B0T3_9SPHN|nr:hypothetical protein [Sphingorhabdus rigui]MBB3942520.1 hypothetical protein [Sphingorhabdus rigui]
MRRKSIILKSIAGAVVGEVIGRKRGHGLLGAGIGVVATRLATRSIPGLLLVGGAIVAKSIYDQRKGRKEG